VSRTSNRTDGDIIHDFLSVAGLLEEPQLAQLYTYLVHGHEATVQDVMEDLELGQGTAYSYVNRLVDAGVVDVTDDEQPRRYAARERGEVTHRLMAEDLDVSPLAAEMILQALRPVVHEHYGIDESGASLDELGIDDGDAADDA
jgi:DNA-binding MarR family transcriptional regulator